MENFQQKQSQRQKQIFMYFGNRDIKFFEWDYWSLYWRKNLTLLQMQSSLIFLRHPRLIRIFWFLPREKKKSKRLVEFRIVCINAIFWYDSNTYVKGLTSIIKQWKMWQLYKPCNIKRHGNSKHFTVHSDHNQCTFCTFVVSILKGIWVEDFRLIFQK